MGRKNVNTTIDISLYKKIKILAVFLNKDANELIEEGMEYVLEKYKGKVPESLF